MTIDYKALGAKIKEYRKKENITQVPVFYYHCNMEKYAVDTLESLIHDVL